MPVHIPQELLLDIFSRLPVKSLLRFRSVSKHWRSIISSSDFINTHLTNSSKTPSFMLTRISGHGSRIEHFTLHSDDNRSVVSVDYLEPEYPQQPLIAPRGLFVVGSCNGLLCLTDNRMRCVNTLLWNPSIRRYFFLPQPSIIFCLMSYLFFGFDSKSKDYKIVKMSYLMDVWHPEETPYAVTEVYALKIGRWETVSSAAPSYDCYILTHEHVYVNGACVRIIFKRRDSCPVILSFDMGDDVFQLMDTPEEMMSSCITGLMLGIRLLQDMVAVFQVLEEEYDYSSTLSVWVMREFGVADSWTRQYSFNFEGPLSRDFYERPSFYGCYYVESFALFNGSSWNVESPPRPADFVLPNWFSKGDMEGEGTGGDDIRTATADKHAIISITSVSGNLVEFLLTS